MYHFYAELLMNWNFSFFVYKADFKNIPYFFSLLCHSRSFAVQVSKLPLKMLLIHYFRILLHNTNTLYLYHAGYSFLVPGAL